MDDRVTRPQLTQFARLFLPSWAEFGVYLVVSLILLSLGSLTAIRNWLGIGSDSINVSSLIPESFGAILTTVRDSSLLPTQSTALFWAGVGGLVDILIWLFGNLLIAVRNDIVVIENYIKPSHTRDVPTAWHEFAESLLVRLSALAAILAFSMVNISVLLPLYVGMFRSAVLHWHELYYLGQGVIGLVGLAVMLHFYVVLLRLVLLRVRILA
jgi:hypothetical protein